MFWITSSTYCNLLVTSYPLNDGLASPIVSRPTMVVTRIEDCDTTPIWKSLQISKLVALRCQTPCSFSYWFPSCSWPSTVQWKTMLTPRSLVGREKVSWTHSAFRDLRSNTPKNSVDSRQQKRTREPLALDLPKPWIRTVASMNFEKNQIYLLEW